MLNGGVLVKSLALKVLVIAAVEMAMLATTTAQPPDSCLVVARLKHHPQFEHNPDSVLFDICRENDPIRTRLYARKRFSLVFKYYAIHLGVASLPLTLCD